MSLFGKPLYTKYKIKVNFNMSSQTQPKNELTLLEMAKEKFGKDKRLMMEIELFLAQKRKIYQNPSKIAWGEQLKLLEKYPQEERLEQVMTSIRNDYRSIAYAKKFDKPEISMEKSDEKDIRYDLEF